MNSNLCTSESRAAVPLQPLLNVNHHYTIATDHLRKAPLASKQMFKKPHHKLNFQRHAYHHANVGLHLVVNSIVQNQVHELIKTPQDAADLPVCIQGNCTAIKRAQTILPEEIKSELSNAEKKPRYCGQKANTLQFFIHEVFELRRLNFRHDLLINKLFLNL